MAKTPTKFKTAKRPGPAGKSSRKALKKKKRATSKGRKVNKSAAIREYAEKNPNEGPTAIAKALTAKGIKVVPAQVSNVLGAKKKKKKLKRKKKASRKSSGVAASSATDSVSLSALLQAQQFAEKVGGVDSAKQLLGAVEKLSN